MSFRKGNAISNLSQALKRLVRRGKVSRFEPKRIARRRFLEQLESRELMAVNIVGLSPADGAVNWALNTDLTLTFDTAVAKGQGNIHVVRNDTGTLGVAVDVKSANVSISPSGTVVTIDLPEDLLAGKAYHVLLDNGTFIDPTVGPTANATLLNQNFDLLPLSPFFTQGGGDGTDYTLVPPLNFSVDNTLMEPNGIPGVPEWRGWSFADKNSWINQGGQSRDEFTLGSGTIAVGDPDEYDDVNDPAEFNSTLYSRPIDLTGVAANSVVLEFDSSFRPEDTQVGKLEVTFDSGTTWEQLLRMDPTNTNNDPSSPTNVNSNLNEHLTSGVNTGVSSGGKGNIPFRSVNNPVGATSAQFRWSVVGGNTWWWGVDNLKVTGQTAGTPFLGVNSSTVWNLDIPKLTVDIAQASISENGGTAIGTVTRNGLPDPVNGFVVNLASSDTTEASVPATVTIPAGSLSATFTITGVNDTLSDRTQTAIITASAPTYESGSKSINVLDDEGPKIVTLSPADNATGIDYQANLIMTFDTPVVRGSGLIHLIRTNGNLLIESIDVNNISKVTVSGSTVTINPAVNLNGLTDYYVMMDDGVLLDASSTVTPNAIVHVQDFNLLPLGPFTAGAGGDGTDFTKTAPLGYSVNNAAMPGPTTSDFYGWTFVDKNAWAARGGSSRAGFTNGSGTIAVADASLWSTNGTDLFSSSMTTAPFSLTGMSANSLTLEFSVSNRGTSTSVARIEASSNGGTTWTNLLEYVGTDVDNSRIVINSTGLVSGTGFFPVSPLLNPTSGTMQFRFSVLDAASGWFAVDGIKISGTKQGVPFQGIATATDWNFTTGVAPTLAVSTNNASMSENGGTAIGTVTRNLGTTGAVTVTLTSSDTTEATVPATVVIPDGQSSATFTITAVDDAIADGDQTVTISATAVDFFSESGSIVVKDDDFPKVATFSPADNSTAVPVASNLVVTFDQNVKKGNGFVHIIRASDNKSAQSIDINSSNVSISGAVVTINPSKDLLGLTDYYIGFEPGAILNLAATVNISTTLLSQDFELLTLGPAVLETAGLTPNGRDFTTTPPTGYSIDNSLMPAGGYPEWTGWSFPTKTFWQTAGGQSRDVFLKGLNTIAVAENDEWDDTATLNNSFNSKLITSPIELGSVVANTVVLEFDSSFRAEGAQTGTLDVSYDGGTSWSNILLLDSSNSSGSVTSPNVNDHLTINVANPSSGTMRFRFGNTGANNWWWAIDNIKVTGNTLGQTFPGIANTDSITWNFTTAEAQTLSLSTSSAPISENGGTATITVSRNLGTTGALIVSLQSSDPASATVPATVTIPDGAPSATFTVTGVDDSIGEGLKNVTITASTVGFVSGTAIVAVSDSEIANVVISELLYRPGSNGVKAEWIEVVNRGSVPADISNWSFDDEDATNWGKIPANTILAPGQVAVFFNSLAFADSTRTVALDAAGFRDLWNVDAGALVVPLFWGDLGDTPSAVGTLNENLVLRDTTNAIIDRANYDDDGVIWPANQVGVSIYLKDIASDNDIGSNWRSAVIGTDGVSNPDTLPVPANSPYNIADRGSPGVVPSATVTPVLAITSGNAVYNNAAYVPSASVTGNNAPAPALSYVFYSDAAGTIVITAPENVGTYYVRAFSAANAGNNAAQSSIASFQITPFALTASATAPNKVYDALTTSAVTINLTGVFAGDTVTGSSTGSFADKNVGTAKTVTVGSISLSGADAANYTVGSSGTTTANITPATLVASFTANNKPFDNTTAATIATRSLSGILGSEVVTVSGGSATFADIGVGNNKTVTATGLVIGGADAGNYTANSTATALANITATVFNRQVFYNDSGYETAAGGSVGAALATNKVLLQSAATTQVTSFANVSNYSRGLNGAVLDIAGLTVTSLAASDFTLRVAPAGASGVQNPSTWAAAPAPSVIGVTAGSATVPGRVRLEWVNNAIQNTWLQIIVKANANTGLSTPQTFYIGHAMAEVNGASPYRVTGADLSTVQGGISNAIVPVNDVRDVNKDRRITGADLSFVQARISNTVLLNNITIPVAGSVSEGAGGGGASEGTLPGASPLTGAPPISLAPTNVVGGLGLVEGSRNDAIGTSSATLNQPISAVASSTSSRITTSVMDIVHASSGAEVDEIVDDLFAGLAKQDLGGFFG